MRIAKNQIDFMTKCKKKCYISSNMTDEEIEIAEYLVLASGDFRHSESD